MLRMSKLLQASPMPLDSNKDQVYYHGIRHGTLAQANQILHEGLKYIPSDYWGHSLRPQEAVYMTKRLEIAFGYAVNAGLVTAERLLSGARTYGLRNLYIAEIPGFNLTHNIEIDEDELEAWLVRLREGDESLLGVSLNSWLDSLPIKTFNLKALREAIPTMPPALAYQLLEEHSNLAHHGPVKVSRVFAWDLSDERKAEYAIRRSCRDNVPFGATLTR